jgi:hypothetical protein
MTKSPAEAGQSHRERRFEAVVTKEMTNEILSQSDMETARSPSALVNWFRAKYDQIRTNPQEVKKARLMLGLYGQFIREIFPLAVYASWRFPDDDVLCQPKIGNQGYDARIWRVGQEDKVHTLEVTWPHDGKGHKEVADLLNRYGSYGWIGDEFERHAHNICERVRDRASKKARNDYRTPGGSALLIVLDTACFPPDESERNARINALADDLRELGFEKVDSVYLITTPHEGVHPVIEKTAAV